MILQGPLSHIFIYNIQYTFKPTFVDPHISILFVYVLQVACAGACFAEGQVKKRDIRPQLPGLEIAGYVQDVCSSLPNKNFTQGDKVILYPDEGVLSTGCAEYLAVSDVSNCIQIPPSIPLEVAAQLSGSALTAYCALIKAKSHVEKLREVKCKCLVGLLYIWYTFLKP